MHTIYLNTKCTPGKACSKQCSVFYNYVLLTVAFVFSSAVIIMNVYLLRFYTDLWLILFYLKTTRKVVNLPTMHFIVVQRTQSENTE